MIILGLGANLPSPLGPPRATLEAALGALHGKRIKIRARSRWYRTAPVPASDQPWFVNGAALLDTDLAAAELLHCLQDVEIAFGRVRGAKNAARILDLDLLAYDDLVSAGPPILPHPRLAKRAFVLLPLRDVAPDWRHPATGEDLAQMIGRLPAGQETYPLDYLEFRRLPCKKARTTRLRPSRRTHISASYRF